MPFKPGEREYRALLQLLRTDERESHWNGREKRFNTSYYAEGYTTTWGNWYWVIPDLFEERFMPGALEGADIADVVMQYDHQGHVYARTSNKTLVIEADNRGVFIASDLAGSAEARNFHEEISSKLCTRMSWSFLVAPEGDEWEEINGVYRRTVYHLKKVFDVSGVSFAANEETEISARSRVEGVIALRRESLERKQKALALLTRL
jgi:HK97 family phage prohead protease